MNPKFSVIITAFNRADLIHRPLMSLKAQTYSDFEVIVVDDDSTDGTVDVVKKIWPTAKIVQHERNLNKAISRNDGMRAATGEWIAWLDSDDMYVPHYLEVLSLAIKQAPEAEIFNFGAIQVHQNYATTLFPQVFYPARVGEGHEVFRAGHIAAGCFIFQRKLLDEIGYLPETSSYIAFAEMFKEQFPEIVPLYPRGEELGNPWGDDYALFYKLTRNHWSIPINSHLYIIWGRQEKELKLD